MINYNREGVRKRLPYANVYFFFESEKEFVCKAGLVMLDRLGKLGSEKERKKTLFQL